MDFTKRNKRSAQAAGPDGDVADPMDVSWDAPIIMDEEDELGGEEGMGSGDEDIMA